jgi:hypothetical protein
MVTTPTVPTDSGIDWTVIGVLLTALFTGGIVVITALAYRLGYREAKARDSVLYKFPLVEIFHHWLFAEGDASKNGFQLRLAFQNIHDAPLGYQMERLKVRFGDQDEWQDLLREAEGRHGGIVAPTLREAFTLPAIGLFQRDQAPTHVSIEFVVKYGTVSHDQITFKWRETQQCVATLVFPVMVRAPESIPFTWTGTAKTELLQETKRGFLRRR